ncbi:MAG: MBL fold metallo-hydrolase [Verrucomicrobia bacterium]|nr:MBL fold metallo-hydrolase [Verrucomicrobiota bacterium]
MKFHFWGTRGSIPSPSTSEVPTQQFGGDTTCVSLQWGADGLLVIDAGSGLRQAGLVWNKAGRKSFTFLFTHSHWDHLQGFPFFTPAFRDDVHIDIYSPRLPGAHAGNLIERSLHAQQSEPFFPAGFPQLRAKIVFHEIQPGHDLSLHSGPDMLRVQAVAASHPGGCLAYRLNGSSAGKNRSVVFATDNEPSLSQSSPLVKLAEETDLLICDGQYSEEEYLNRHGWGHGTPELCLNEAISAKARRLIITHFDPAHSDAVLIAMEKKLRQSANSTSMEVTFARQGQTIDL